MDNVGAKISRHGLEKIGLTNAGRVYWNLPTPRLYEEAIRRQEGTVVHGGPLAVRTGTHTGRSPNDRFIVREETSEDDIWWGPINRPIDEKTFDDLFRQVQAYCQGRDLFVFDGYVGADERYRRKVRVINEKAYHNLFARNMFLRELDRETLEDFAPDFTVIDMPNLLADPDHHGINSKTFIVLNFKKRLVLIGGSSYSGEMKKSIFGAMNYFLPKAGVLSMHCSANYGSDRNDVALFFGLSGTGKTTLSADPDRTLIGDDEHGWSDDGIFNLEGGCYAKVIRLDAEGEPEIYSTTRRFATILENVIFDENCRVDLNDDRLTENTRASYPISHIDNADLSGIAGHPRNVVFLTADAFGVLPPISKLTREQAMYHFLSGYTAKVAGTERGVTEPKPAFSACFGAPFMPLHPAVYADLLGKKIDEHDVKVWLVNTGWTGGPYGVGSRIRLKYTRRMIAAALQGELDDSSTQTDPVFGLHIPTAIEGVPGELLFPRNTWDDPEAYDAQATKLANMFVENFRQFEEGVNQVVIDAGPQRETV